MQEKINIHVVQHHFEPQISKNDIKPLQIPENHKDLQFNPSLEKLKAFLKLESQRADSLKDLHKKPEKPVEKKQKPDAIDIEAFNDISKEESDDIADETSIKFKKEDEKLTNDTVIVFQIPQRIPDKPQKMAKPDAGFKSDHIQPEIQKRPILMTADHTGQEPSTRKTREKKTKKMSPEKASQDVYGTFHPFNTESALYRPADHKDGIKETVLSKYKKMEVLPLASAEQQEPLQKTHSPPEDGMESALLSEDKKTNLLPLTLGEQKKERAKKTVSTVKDKDGIKKPSLVEKGENKTSDLSPSPLTSHEKKEPLKKKEATPTFIHLDHQNFRQQTDMAKPTEFTKSAPEKQGVPFTGNMPELKKEVDTGNQYYFKSWKGAEEKSVSITMSPKTDNESAKLILAPSSAEVRDHLKEHWEGANKERWVLLDDDHDQQHHKNKKRQEKQTDEESA